jgi:predicted transcriptional regulator
LRGAKLIERDSQGAYALTDLGRMALMLIPSFKFLARWREYVVSHDLSLIPTEFVERIGELTEGEYAETVGDVLKLFGDVLNQSQKFVWLMADQFLMQDAVAAKVLKGDGVQLRVICPAQVMKKVGSPPFPNQFRGRVELGLVEKVSAGLALNEKVAGVTFPDKSGKLDFDSGFSGGDPLFYRWCEDLFRFHWSKARVVPEATLPH